MRNFGDHFLLNLDWLELLVSLMPMEEVEMQPIALKSDALQWLAMKDALLFYAGWACHPLFVCILVNTSDMNG